MLKRVTDDSVVAFAPGEIHLEMKQMIRLISDFYKLLYLFGNTRVH